MKRHKKGLKNISNDESLCMTDELMKIFYCEATHICSGRGEALALARSVLKYFLKSYPSYPIHIIRAT